MPSPFDTRPEIAPPSHATIIHFPAQHLSTQVYSHVAPRRKSSTFSCNPCFRRLWQRIGKKSSISSNENQAFPMATFTLVSRRQPTSLPFLLACNPNPVRCVPTRFPLKGSVVSDAPVCSFQHMFSVAFRMRAHDKVQ